MVPITLTVRIGTMMSPSAGISHRLTTVFTSRWFIAIMIPLPGRTWTSQPAMEAIWPAQAPEAFTTNSASIANSSPVRSFRTLAPVTVPFRVRRASTRWYGRMVAPCSFADRAHPQTVFHVSMAASGTTKQREISGLMLGSRRRASPAGISSTGMPAT